jgi:phosphopantetheinyl transferase (holo-ACP synthase)
MKKENQMSKTTKKGLQDLAAMQEEVIEQEDAQKAEFLAELLPDFDTLVDETKVEIESELAEVERSFATKMCAYAIREWYRKALSLAREKGLEETYQARDNLERQINTTVVVHGVKVAKAPKGSPQLEALERLNALIRQKEQLIGSSVALALSHKMGIPPMTLDDAYSIIRHDNSLFESKKEK